MTHGRGSIVASTLVSHGSSSSISRVCCPAVTISGVLFWNAVSRLPIAFPSPAPVCRLTSAGRRVACANPSAIAITEASCSPSTYRKSEGKPARNVSSVEPTLPKIVVRPCARSSS